MEIDPEVQALLDENPATLPAECVKEGWGYHTMRYMVANGQLPPRAPSDSMAPTYTETCHQCGRPITLGRRDKWQDHAARTWCDRALIARDEYSTNHHVTEHEYNVAKRISGRSPVAAPPEPPPTPTRKKGTKTANCSATKHRPIHTHICAHKDGHFGFHECRECRHLWK